MHEEFLEFADNVPDKLVCYTIDTPIALCVGFHNPFVLENGQVLTDNWLGLFKTLPEVGYTSILLLNQAEYFQP
jgi:hypothetical protein